MGSGYSVEINKSVKLIYNILYEGVFPHVNHTNISIHSLKTLMFINII